MVQLEGDEWPGGRRGVFERLRALSVDPDAATPGFAELGLGENIVRALADLGAAHPFPVQAAAIPAILDGRDVLARGRTGSGKTIAFAAPMATRLGTPVVLFRTDYRTVINGNFVEKEQS